MEMEEQQRQQQLQEEDTFSSVLQNPLLMSNIFKYLPDQLLAPLRCTCMAWNNIIKSKYLCIKLTNDNLAAFLGTATSTSSNNGDDITKSTDTNSDYYTYTKYHLHNISIDDDDPDIISLFHKYGKFMTCLKITLKDHSNQFSIDSFRKIIFHQAPNLVQLEIIDQRDPPPTPTNKNRIPTVFWNQGSIFNGQDKEQQTTFSYPLLPKLKRLKFKTLIDADRQQTEEFLTDLINSAINLDHFQLSHHTLHCHRPQPKHNSTTMQALFVNQTNFDVQKLKTLKLRFLSTQQLNQLIHLTAAKQLALNKFKVTIQGEAEPDPDQENLLALEKFLQAQAPWLKTLHVEVDGTPNWITLALKLPILPMLEHLKLQLFFIGVNVTFDSIPINFPALKTLKYHNGIGCVDEHIYGGNKEECVRWDGHVQPSKPSLSLQHLDIGCIQVKRPQKITNLAIAFPNLKKLVIQLESLRLLTWLCSSGSWLVGLQSLAVDCSRWNEHGGEPWEKSVEVGHNLVDEYLTGVPKQHHQTLMILGSKGSGGSNKEVLRKLKTKPGISDFKGLCELKLSLGTRITDFSVYFGLGLLSPSKLKTLEIEDAAQISVECRENLKASLGLGVCIHYGEK